MGVTKVRFLSKYSAESGLDEAAVDKNDKGDKRQEAENAKDIDTLALTKSDPVAGEAPDDFHFPKYAALAFLLFHFPSLAATCPPNCPPADVQPAIASAAASDDLKEIDFPNPFHCSFTQLAREMGDAVRWPLCGPKLKIHYPNWGPLQWTWLGHSVQAWPELRYGGHKSSEGPIGFAEVRGWLARMQTTFFQCAPGPDHGTLRLLEARSVPLPLPDAVKLGESPSRPKRGIEDVSGEGRKEELNTITKCSEETQVENAGSTPQGRAGNGAAEAADASGKGRKEELTLSEKRSDDTPAENANTTPLAAAGNDAAAAPEAAGYDATDAAEAPLTSDGTAQVGENGKRRRIAGYPCAEASAAEAGAGNDDAGEAPGNDAIDASEAPVTSEGTAQIGQNGKRRRLEESPSVEASAAEAAAGTDDAAEAPGNDAIDAAEVSVTSDGTAQLGQNGKRRRTEENPSVEASLTETVAGKDGSREKTDSSEKDFLNFLQESPQDSEAVQIGNWGVGARKISFAPLPESSFGVVFPHDKK